MSVKKDVPERDKPFWLVFLSGGLLAVVMAMMMYSAQLGLDLGDIFKTVIGGISAVVIMGFTKYFDKSTE